MKRYYFQKEPPGVRRYDGSTCEKWSLEDRRWTSECAPERACRTTGDRPISEAQALQWIATARPAPKGAA